MPGVMEALAAGAESKAGLPRPMGSILTCPLVHIVLRRVGDLLRRQGSAFQQSWQKSKLLLFQKKGVLKIVLPILNGDMMSRPFSKQVKALPGRIPLQFSLINK